MRLQGSFLEKLFQAESLQQPGQKKYADVPFAENFSYLNGNLELEEYKEGIYVGYRYFDSFGVKPLFPFWLLVFLIQILRFSFAVLKLTRIRLQ